jgi:hypothetical protein
VPLLVARSDQECGCAPDDLRSSSKQPPPPSSESEWNWYGGAFRGNSCSDRTHSA